MYLLSILLFTFVYLLSFNSVIEENREPLFHTDFCNSDDHDIPDIQCQ